MTRISRLVAALAAALLLVAAGGLTAFAGNGTPIDPHSSNPLTLAVIGDTPYGAAQAAAFPTLIDWINGDPDVDLALHVGDIKNGSSVCSDAYFDQIRAGFDTFKDPLVYTPGDNEWTDCHRTSNGAYLPTERLATLRETFFDQPGVSLGGRPKQVLSQAAEGFPENALWMQSQVVFATVHAVGSNNDLNPWFGAAETDAQRQARLAEFEARRAAGLSWIDAAFDTAIEHGAAGVLLAMQADMWDGAAASQTGFAELKERIAARAAAFEGPVLLIQGDSHDYLVDQPFAQSPNVTRLVVEGETIDEWLRLTIDPLAPELFAWTREQR